MSLLVNKRGMLLKTVILTLIFMVAITSTAWAYDEDTVADWLVSQCSLNRNGEVVYSNKLSNILKDYPYVENAESETHAISINVEEQEHMVYLSGAAYEQIGAQSDKSANRERVQEKVDTMGVNFNVEADVESAGVALSGFEKVVGMLVGLLAYLIVLGMVLFTSLDICYITMPVFKNKADEMVQRGGMMTKKDNKTGEVKHRWVTDDAQYAVAHATIENGKSPLTIYLGKRIWAYIMLAIVLFILLTGNIQLIVNIAINFISGLIEALEGLA